MQLRLVYCFSFFICEIYCPVCASKFTSNFFCRYFCTKHHHHEFCRMKSLICICIYIFIYIYIYIYTCVSQNCLYHYINSLIIASVSNGIPTAATSLFQFSLNYYSNSIGSLLLPQLCVVFDNFLP